ncbi:zinc-binding dehydrogenase [Pseudonocardia sp. ICBG601]|uniref:zinc-binding dehydrogenase n=1 Tax=Pseudonocardia sp. ICBG601 TaxID=2846759 RepID=UPI001CF6ED7E|nr:zinc-binding dehydrogenase [Pseudonocardia sp. ICBG601]
MSTSAIFLHNNQLRVSDTPAPEAGPDEVVIAVERVSLNAGEARIAWDPDKPAGWDAVGIVQKSSRNGHGPAVGNRVATWGQSGAWSTHRVVDHRDVAVVPPSVDDLSAAALPVAGLTALRSIRQLGLSSGQRILISGASGGVGHLAVQLAQNCGLDTTAVVGSEASRRWLLERGLVEADKVKLASELAAPADAPFDGAIDVAGGPVLERLVHAVAPGATILLVGGASDRPAALDVRFLSDRGLNLVSFNNYASAGIDLALLLDLVVAGALKIAATSGGDWSLLVEKPLTELITRGKVTFAVSSVMRGAAS